MQGNYRVAPDHTIGRTTMLSGPGRVQATAPLAICVSRSVCASSNTTFHALRRTLHDKAGPFNDEPLPIFWGAGSCGHCLGADAPAIAGPVGKNLGPGLVGQIGGSRYPFNRNLGSRKV